VDDPVTPITRYGMTAIPDDQVRDLCLLKDCPCPVRGGWVGVILRGRLLEAHATFAKLRGAGDKETRDWVQGLVDLYTAWDAAESGKGHDEGRLEGETAEGDRAPAAGEEVTGGPSFATGAAGRQVARV
jgi:hypothetical protein